MQKNWRSHKKKVYFMMGNKQKEHGKDLGNMFVHDLSGDC